MPTERTAALAGESASPQGAGTTGTVFSNTRDEQPMPSLFARLARLFGRPVTAACLAAALLAPSGSPVPASELRRDAIVKAIESAQPSVVNIHGEKQLAAGETRFGPVEGQRRVNGMGTGVVIDERGYILTNFHVVDGVSKIHVALADGQSFVARVVASDAATDLAVIKIDTDEQLPTIAVGTSSDLMLGEQVIAVGNAFGYENTVTRGIISALHRTVQVTDAQTYEDLIQTDASINPGNSGGPLINIDGEMIGINVAVRAGALGIGFAIPVDKAMAVAGELLSTRRIDRTWHGVIAKRQAAPRAGGFEVGEVDADSPAAESGIMAGDVVKAVGDRPVTRPLDFERALLGRPAGEPVDVTIHRDNADLQIALVLAREDNAPPAEAEPVWDVLGLRLEQIAKPDFQQYNTRYRGGLKVLEVRADGPAGRQGIRRGDVLVGMHVWETVSMENVSYILNRADFDSLSPLKFYILRGGETLYGHLQVASRP
jgi:serine protease Do